KTKTPYNPLYDRMHKAGLTLHQQRICHPYGDDQKRGLWLYHIIEPGTWGRVAARVQGANYGAKYAQASGNITGKITITKPEGMTWQRYAEVLLESMPPPTAEHYKNKIQQFLRWYHERGYPNGSIPDDGPLDRRHPSWKRIVKVLLSFDYYCKGLSFSPTNKAAKEQLAALRRRQRAEYNFPGVGISQARAPAGSGRPPSRAPGSSSRPVEPRFRCRPGRPPRRRPRLRHPGTPAMNKKKNKPHKQNTRSARSVPHRTGPRAGSPTRPA